MKLKNPTKKDLMTEGDRRQQETIWRSKQKKYAPTVLDKKTHIRFDNFDDFKSLDSDEALEMAEAIVKRIGKK